MPGRLLKQADLSEAKDAKGMLSDNHPSEKRSFSPDGSQSSDKHPAKSKRPRSARPGAAAISADHRVRDALDQNLPPIHELSEIFAAIVDKAMAHGLPKVLEYLSGRPLRIATMCSGTESPILALKMIAEALDGHGSTFRTSHVFSAEIEPYKQAYIERNFHPPILFRDIEELTSGQGSTAYGKVTEVPPMGEVHMLVAGFACVDFSKLNTTTKAKLSMVPLDVDGKTYTFPSRQKREENPDLKFQLTGESFGTLFAILDYTEKYRPPIVILENVMGAPWDAVRRAFEDIDYAAAVTKLDTKDYAIPHTRQRKYLLALDQRGPLGSTSAQQAVIEWSDALRALQRRASSSVEAFLLHRDDPRLASALAELSKASTRNDGRMSREIDWKACQVRYKRYRGEKGLGTARPYTQWIKHGSSRMPDHADLEWGQRQPDRIKDTLDILLLQGFKRGYDISYKPRYPDLSQNVDRNEDASPWGLTGCVTPSGMPFSTFRGAPIVGIEALNLQALPIDELHFTSESNRDLQDLAGNAMTASVVGAAMLGALIVGYESIPQSWLEKGAVLQARDKSLDRLRPTQGLLPETRMNFGPRKLHIANELHSLAERTARRCFCESSGTISLKDIHVCKDCGHTACETCLGIPPHNYEEIINSRERTRPQVFSDLVVEALPTRMVLTLTADMFLKMTSHYQPTDPPSEHLLARILSTLGQEVRLHSVNRSEVWRIVYEGANCHLHLTFDLWRTQWTFFIKPEPHIATNDELRGLLQHPVARMEVRGPDLLDGEWQICLPQLSFLEMTIRGEGQLIDSPRAALGLELSCGQQIWSRLRVESVHEPEHTTLKTIAGEYEKLPACGMSLNSLYRKAEHQHTKNRQPIFLFMDPERIGDPSNDVFVFSTDLRRLEFGERRTTFAKLLAVKGSKGYWRPTNSKEEVVRCSVSGQWQHAQAALLPIGQDASTSSTLRQQLHMAQGNCEASYSTILSCNVTWSQAMPPRLRRNVWTTLTKTNEGAILRGLLWLTSRIPNQIAYSGWIIFDGNLMHSRCTVCAPPRPSILWKLLEVKAGAMAKPRGTQKPDKPVKWTPYEDPYATGNYESAMKMRPQPLETQIMIDATSMAHLRVHLNAQALVHQAAANLPICAETPSLETSWRLSQLLSLRTDLTLPKFTLRSNDGDENFEYTFPGTPQDTTTYKLEPQQARSLRWMISQDGDALSPFYEQEVVEACAPYFGLRVEARVRRPRQIRGGILADKVGFGKTITTLALIANATVPSGTNLHLAGPRGFIGVKATLVIVPSLLVDQWADEAAKLFGGHMKVLTIRSIKDIQSAKVSTIATVDVILVPTKLLTHEHYLQRLALFAGVPECPATGESRAFSAWLARAMERLQDTTQSLKAGSSLSAVASALQQQLAAALEDHHLRHRLPSKRYKGAAYAARKSSTATPASLERSDEQNEIGKGTELIDALNSLIDRSRLNKARSLDEVRELPLHMFHFHRVVVDEYSYIEKLELAAVTSLSAHSRWALSGTPALADFADVKNVARFLGIHLGIDDDAPWNTNHQALLRMKADRTDAERFEALQNSRSFEWHEYRQTLAQEFLDRYVRQNIADVSKIRRSTEYRPVVFASAERTFYTELTIKLAVDRGSLHLDTKTEHSSDRKERLDHLLGSLAKSPADALIFCTTCIPRSSQKEPYKPNVHDEVLGRRQEGVRQLQQLVSDALVSLKSQPKLFKPWYATAEAGYFGDPEVTRTLQQLGRTTHHVDRQTTVMTIAKMDHLIIDLVERVRALRLLLTIGTAQAWPFRPFQADCGHEILDRHDFSVLAHCGHTVCSSCIPNDRSTQCFLPGCKAAGGQLHCFSAAELNGGLIHTPRSSSHTSKIQQIVHLLKSIDATDKVLICVQNDHVMDALGEALTHETIAWYKIPRKDAETLRGAKNIMAFKTAEYGEKDWRQVLLLNSADSSAAGHNIQKANHIIFVSTLFVSRQEAFDAAYEQAIGRCLRYGQRKAVHIYHFLALKTIDINLMEQRTSKKLVLNSSNGLLDLEQPRGAGQFTSDWAARLIVTHELDEEEILD